MNEWIDLSLEIDKDTLPFPGDIPLKLDWEKSFDQDGYNLSILSLTMHLGTHIDYKKHVLNVEDKISHNQFMGKANVIFIEPSNHLIKTNDIIQAYQYIENKEDILIMSINHEKKLNEEAYFKYPKFEKSIFKFLMANHIRLLGADLPSFEYEEGNLLEMHKDLLNHDIYLIENLCHLDVLRSHIEFIALPLPIKTLEASMVRAIAKNL
ncbi:MAG: cyclase family protein [Tenericutes bacterium]|jgi:arylformamidase|nr:cyclase family protein [Mycoplasmatota bacterium]